MNKTETITIALDKDLMDTIRKEAVKDFRSINKQIAFLITKALKEGNRWDIPKTNFTRLIEFI